MRTKDEQILQDWIPSGDIVTRFFNYKNMIAFAKHYEKENKSTCGATKCMWQFSYDKDFKCIEFEIMIASDEDKYEKGKEFVGETQAPYLWYREKQTK